MYSIVSNVISNIIMCVLFLISCLTQSQLAHLLLFCYYRFGRSCCLDCVSSTPWCKSDANLVHLAGTSRTDLTSRTFASVSDNYRCSSMSMMRYHMMPSPTSQAIATMEAGSPMTGTGNLRRDGNCHTIFIVIACSGQDG